MSTVNALLTQRIKKSDQSSKMAEMARQTANGNLTSFSGVFSVTELSETEKGFLEKILHEFSNGKDDISQDLGTLVSLTSEVKAINNQAALLHGERIKKAQSLLITYREGAFSAWLIAAYGNRQTPYNLLQYYEFHEALPKELRTRVETMPRQAVYTLASRDGPLEKKQALVAKYNGETKTELLTLIRSEFPLSDKDKRKQDLGDVLVKDLKKIVNIFSQQEIFLKGSQKAAMMELLNELAGLVDYAKLAN
jgi:hypothetical protein